MLLKEYARIWPPVGAEKVALEDVVSAVTNVRKGKLGLLIRNQTVPLSVPESLQQKLIFDILRKKTTLREVGELPIS